MVRCRQPPVSRSRERAVGVLRTLVISLFGKGDEGAFERDDDSVIDLRFRAACDDTNTCLVLRERQTWNEGVCVGDRPVASKGNNVARHQVEDKQ